MRRFLNKRTLFIVAAVILVVCLSAVSALYLYINSPTFNERLRAFIVERIAAHTGTRVSLGSLRWSLKEQRVVLDDLTLRGNEPASSPPLAHIESVKAGVHFRSLLYRRLDLYELHIVNPEIRFNVDSEGRTSLPTPKPPVEGPESQFAVSIANLKVTGGKAFINDQQSNIDFQIENLKSDLKYGGVTRRLSATVSYDGVLKPANRKPVPYKLDSEFDYTAGTLIAQTVKITTGKSSATFHGKVDKVFTRDIEGKLAYDATLDAALLKDYLPEHTTSGGALAEGELEFSSEKFSTNGDVSSREIALNEWKARSVKAHYAYQYPKKQLTLTRISTQILDGSAEGSIFVDNIPGDSRVTTNLKYNNVDVAQLARVYPWDPKYMIYSRATGQLHGSFEGRFERYEFYGDSTLASYRPDAAGGTVALPVDGTIDFSLTPGETSIGRSDLRFMNSNVTASGRITGTTQADLTVNLTSRDLADFRFIYPDANGQGSFKGTVRGDIAKPVVEGTISLDGHKYREWTIQHAEGGVKFDAGTQVATLQKLSAKLGDSTATLNGTTSLDGKSINLRIQSDHVRAEDFESITKEKVSGNLSGDVTLTSLDPIKVSGHVTGLKLSARGHTFEKIDADLTYNDPVLQLRNVTASERGAQLSARTIDYNKSTGAIALVNGEIASIALDRLRDFGIPETVNGTLREGRINVTGTQDRPQITGNATVENLSFRGETFPRATLRLSTAWPKLTVIVSETGNVNLRADIDLSAAGYPFEATAVFENYPVERLAKFSQGTLSVSGNATFRGQLTGQKPLSGEGTIRNLDAKIRDVEFHNASPFEFALEPNRIRLDRDATFTGAYGTKLNVKGAVGLAAPTMLDLEVSGDFDLKEVAAATEEWSIAGTVSLNGRVNGTATNPAINGLLKITNASLGRENIYTTLAGLNGDLRFDANRVNFENLRGRVGGGDVQIRGSALIRNAQLEAMDLRVDARNPVRLRYPAGLQSSVTGSLNVTGSSAAPLVSGDLMLNRMSYESPFESFLAIFRAGGLDSGGSMLDRVRLAIHVTGNRNITVKNELADIASANVDLNILGTWGSPSIIGHAEVSEGLILFQGKKYEVTRGNIDFVNRLKIEPVVDIQAETDVRDYRVILTVAGKGDRIRATFSTDPPLPETEVISLVAGGKTRDELQGTSTPTSDELFQSGAKNIVAGQLLSNLGRRAGLMGLDWIRLDPQFQTSTNNPSLRLTVSQQVSRDLAVTYSQDLASTQQRVVTVEYFLSKNLSVVASREETNDASALGLDIKLRRRY